MLGKYLQRISLVAAVSVALLPNVGAELSAVEDTSALFRTDSSNFYDGSTFCKNKWPLALTTICNISNFNGYHAQISRESIILAERLLRQGYEHIQTKQYDAALVSYQNVLRLCRQIKHLECIGKSLDNMGYVYLMLGQYPLAIESYQQAIIILRQIGNRPREAIVLNNLGLAYQRMGQYHNALEIAQQALQLYRKIGDRKGEGFALTNIGGIYQSLSQYPQALDFLQQAMIVYQTLGDQSSAAEGVSNIGLVHSYLGDYPKALDLFHQALEIQQKVGNLPGQSATFQYIGFLYRRQNQEAEAIKFYGKALDIRRSLKDQNGVTEVLNNIGESYERLGKYPQALETLEEALHLAQALSGRDHEGNITDNLATVYKQLGQYSKAMELYHEALAIEREVGNRNSERITLSNIGDLLKRQNQTILAIAFYKQSVSLTELIRHELRVLPHQQQESYTRSIADTYRELADLLLEQNRVLEAQQVLDLLKLQELNDYLQNVRGGEQPLIVLQQEAEILKRHRALQQGAIAAGKELAELEKRARSGDKLSAAEEKRKQELVALRQALNQQFNNFMSSNDVRKLVQQLTPTEIEARLSPDVLRGAGKTMAQLNAVLLYPLVLDDRLELIITAPNAQPLRRTVKGVGRKQLNEAILKFRNNLQPSSNSKHVKLIAQQLYSWLIKPIEPDLQAANAKTIIYAPDGQLRYIPLAALYDGQHWLIERYQINNITAKAIDDLTAHPQPKPRILAGAFGAADKTVTVAGRNFDFAGLSFTTKEVELLAKLSPNTRTMFDQTFTVKETTSNMNDYTIVHLATHAALVPEAADHSFILFRDEAATLKDIDSWILDNVDLIVLSACETGLGGKFGQNGEEVLGLGYQFTKQDKARAAIASLWQVNDGSTQQLMNAFYTALKQGKTKAQALQEAQKALITGNYSRLGDQQANMEVGDSGTRETQTTSNHALQHPYYWAPFILIGNGL